MHSGCFPAYGLRFRIPVTLLRTSNQKKKINNNNNRLYKKNLNFLKIIIFNQSQNSAFYYLILHRNLHLKIKNMNINIKFVNMKILIKFNYKFNYTYKRYTL